MPAQMDPTEVESSLEELLFRVINSVVKRVRLLDEAGRQPWWVAEHQVDCQRELEV